MDLNLEVVGAAPAPALPGAGEALLQKAGKPSLRERPQHWRRPADCDPSFQVSSFRIQGHCLGSGAGWPVWAAWHQSHPLVASSFRYGPRRMGANA